MRCATALRPGGVFAAFWNWPTPGRHPLRPEMEAVYAEHAPEIAASTLALMGMPGFDPDLRARQLAVFDRHEQRTYPWAAEYTGRAYTDMLRTHSDHRLLAPDQLDAVVEAVVGLIDAAGGTITVEYETFLLMGWTA